MYAVHVVVLQIAIPGFRILKSRWSAICAYRRGKYALYCTVPKKRSNRACKVRPPQNRTPGHRKFETDITRKANQKLGVKKKLTTARMTTEVSDLQKD
jgi:hypothetical protein